MELIHFTANQEIEGVCKKHTDGNTKAYFELYVVYTPVIARLPDATK